MRGSRISARAMAERCFCPPDRVMPRSPTIVSYFVGKILDITVEARDFSRFADLRQLKFLKTKGDIFADGFAEEIGVLRNKADRAPQGFKRPLVDGMAVNQNFSLGSFPKARNQGSQSGFAAAGGSDNRQGRPAGISRLISFSTDAGLVRAAPLLPAVPLPVMFVG